MEIPGMAKKVAHDAPQVISRSPLCEGGNVWQAYCSEATLTCLHVIS
ncbi:hypothetical protein [Geomonas edaphica]|nr:hypothetical protein [Geomonas edaphica]